MKDYKIGVDWGKSNDPTIIVWYKREDGKYIIDSQFTNKGEEDDN